MKNVPAKLLAIIAVIAFTGACITAITQAPALDPGAYVEAHATATAIAPALYPTVRYNEEVLPALQDTERKEATSTTGNAAKWQRNIDTASGIARVTMTASFALGITLVSVGAGIGIGGWAAGWGVRSMREATLPLTRQLAEGAHVTEYGTFVHTATGAVVLLNSPQDARPGHGRLIAPSYAATPEEAVMLGRLLERQRQAWRVEDEGQGLLME
jgi:hypothetical protein